jgi:hypothetical protein
MNSPDRSWEKLVAAARRAPVETGAAPYGFATRVVAQAYARPSASPAALLEKFAWRGLFAAGAFSVAAVAFGFTEFGRSTTDELAAATDPVAELLDAS